MCTSVLCYSNAVVSLNSFMKYELSEHIICIDGKMKKKSITIIVTWLDY